MIQPVEMWKGRTGHAIGNYWGGGPYTINDGGVRTILCSNSTQPASTYTSAAALLSD